MLKERTASTKKTAFLISALLILIFTLEAVSSQKAALPEPYRKWLEEEIVYIITPLEKDVFLKLRTDRERDLFIDAFWKHRDPNPGAKENSFKAEHYKRITYANRYYGRTSPLPGWKTDRGRIHIILGEPGDIQRFPGGQGVYPTEVWFYQNKKSEGLEVGFNILFFQERGQGDYRLYSPSRDGPQALLTAYMGDPTDYRMAYQRLQDIQPALASVSMSLIPGEGSIDMGQPSMASDMLIQKIENTPQRLVEDRYAQKFLQYKDSVEVEYSTNYMDSDSLVSVLRDPSGLYFVHYAIEPKRLSVDSRDDKYFANIKVNGTVSSPEGRMIFQFDRSVSFNLDTAQIRSAVRAPFDFHDMFPLIPGTYRISVLLKNDVSKEFTSLERTVVIPGAAPALQMTAPILGYRTGTSDAGRKRLKPFQLGSTQIYCQPGRIFTRKNTLAVGFQLFGLTPAQASSGALHYVISRTGQPPFEKTRPLAEYADAPNILESFPLGDFPPAHYVLKVAVVADGRELISAADEFDVTYQPDIPRPWFYSRLMPEVADPAFDQIVGSQLLNSGRAREAQSYLEKAYRQKPDSEDAALSLSQAYMALGETSKIPALLTPFLTAAQAPQYEVFVLAGKAYGKLGEWAKAVEILNQTVARFGVNAVLLNEIGENYIRLGRIQEALAALEKSLEINPQQPEIRTKIGALKEKK